MNLPVVGSVGILPLLGIIFIVLKITGYIAWSWLWVLSPFWIGIVLGAIVYVLAAVLGWNLFQNMRR